MSASSYDEALARLLAHEGGYSNHPADPGGPTNFGITIADARAYWKADATAADVRAMPLAVAKEIYRTRYWSALRCDDLPAGIDYAVFDYGVNSGIGRVGRVLRRLLGLTDDTSAITDDVLAAVRARAAKPLIEAICDERLAFLERLKTWPVFGTGWARRVREVEAFALELATATPQPQLAAPAAPKPVPSARNWLGTIIDFVLAMLDRVFARHQQPVSATTRPVGGGDTLAERIVAAMRRNGYQIAEGADVANIVYVEGIDPDGTPNDNAPNQFNDLRTVVRVVDGKASFAGIWEGTTEPSRYWTTQPMNPAGAARIAFGRYESWTVGLHGHDQHEALVQVAPLTVCRDLNRDFKRDGDRLDTGLFGINQHCGYDLPKNDLMTSSAGCLVGRTRAGHREFMAIVKADRRYLADPKGWRFPTVILPAAEIR